MSSSPQETERVLKYSDDNYFNGPESEERFVHVKSRQNPLLSYSLVFIATSILWGTVCFMMTDSSNWKSSPFPNRPTPNPGARHNITSNHHLLMSCGNSSTSARASNCTYDILLNHWVPSPCYDPEFLEEYKDDGSSTAYSDEAMTQVLTVDEVMDREFYFTSVRDHINHCATMWKKQFNVLFEEKKAFDSIVASPFHTDHCAYYLTLEGRNLTQATRVEVGFAGCWIRGEL